MKMIRGASLLLLASWLVSTGAQAENTVAVNEVMKLESAGVGDDTIVAFVQNKNINYDLSADSILKLKNQGVSSAVLNAMLGSGVGTPTPQPSPAPVATAAPQPIPAPPPTTLQSAPAVVLPAATASPDVAYFYQELSPYGRWILVEDGQWCWQPTVAASTVDWRPYWDKGHWVWTDQGWYWASDYSWGWAAFHYGRWHLHPHHGWVWFPDRVWGPSWVVWRSGGEYCGWAPLPPGAVYDTVGARFVFHGKVVDAGFDFGLGLAHFSFCIARNMGEPLPRHFHAGPEIRTVFERTTIVNHYTVNRVVVGGETHVQVVNHGIDHARIVTAKGHPMEEVRIRELNAPAPGHSHEHLDAQAKTLDIYRPHFGNPH